MYDESILSDLHKDVFGFRPREGYWKMWESFDEVGKQKEWDYLCNQLELSMERERIEKNNNIIHLSATINNIMDICRCSWSNAVHILMDAEDIRHEDIGYFLWHYGIVSYEFEKQFSTLMKKL